MSSSGTTALQETTHTHTFGTSTTDAASSSSSSTSTSLATSSSSSSTSTSTTRLTTTTTTTKGTTSYVPPQTESTVPYVRQTIPPEPSTPEEVEIHHPEPAPEDYIDNYINPPEPPVPEAETEPPPIFRTPPPVYNNNPGIYHNPTRSPKKNQHNRINSEAEERTAMIIGIVAGALIAVILVILLVLWIKSNGDRSYKMEHDLKYGHGANAALLGHNAGHSNNQQHGGGGPHHGASGGHGGGYQNGQHHNQQYGNGYNGNGGNYDAHGNGGGHHSSNMGQNGSLRQHGSQHSDRNGMSAGLVQPKAKRNSKDIKEWYV